MEERSLMSPTDPTNSGLLSYSKLHLQNLLTPKSILSCRELRFRVQRCGFGFYFDKNLFAQEIHISRDVCFPFSYICKPNSKTVPFWSSLNPSVIYYFYLCNVNNEFVDMAIVWKYKVVILLIRKSDRKRKPASIRVKVASYSLA